MGHCRRVARYSVKLAKGMGLKENEVRTVYFGALLHDVGLVKLDVLGSIDKEKYKLHAAAGGEMVKNVYQWKNVAQMIRDHHERPDGLGYPAGLSGTDISVGGRIIGLAEAFDVMTSRHSYKPAISFDEAATEIKILAGYQFDPEVVNVFLKMFSADDVEDA
jgi:putative nucleotidyltransferase with HDIG domain